MEQSYSHGAGGSSSQRHQGRSVGGSGGGASSDKKMKPEHIKSIEGLLEKQGNTFRLISLYRH